MLCPDCRQAAPGGTPCPQCGNQVPERESFGGRSGQYFFVLLCIAVLSLASLVAAASIGRGLRATLRGLYETGWIWLYLGVSSIPIAIGLYYWSLLREEEITVTDEWIARRSHWGDERLAWSDIRAFRRRPVLFRQTRLGRIAWLSRFFAQRELPPASYELEWSLGPDGISSTMRLEPGTIDDMPWLLELIEERLGPPEES